ncbi:Digestive organ expansion factor [Fasciolopsis buskii]|uniref:U3 small nucleolar RNA-associated protein 25 homolog n=1 Tax=Fasciolopsis buskii TaxID=27845 RepID=A0A8E0VNE2_9TREM|nr:Digestive organ expansion factor [Fasciolopsis buski]
MEEDITDAPVEGSAYMRHFSFPYEEATQIQLKNAKALIDPQLGFYKTSVARGFPQIPSKDPVEVKLSHYESSVYNMISNYEDLLFCRRFPDDQKMRLLYCAHALNHCLRSRKLMIKNNEKEKRFGISDDLRDQGFHRARVLILAPTKEAARRIVHTFLGLMPKGSTVSHRKRFERDFGPQTPEAQKNNEIGRKPKDYKEWFSCNTGDHFRIGIAFSKKTVKLYSAFMESDLILASPLGLKSIIEEEKDKEADLQYITASTELLVIDQAEALLMQNWANVLQIVGLLNQRPTKASFSSAARIRLAYLAGYGKLYRQSLIFSAVAAPQIVLLTGECENFQGLNYIPPTPHYPGMYSTYLLDHVRVPGLKPDKCKDDGSTPPSKKARVIVSVSHNTSPEWPDVKLNLIPFAVFDQAECITSHPFSSDSVTDDDDNQAEMDSAANDHPKHRLSNTNSNSQQIVVYSAQLPQKNPISWSGRAMPIARMNAFKQRVLPKLRRGLDSRVLIYVPDFYDLEELRLLLTTESLDFCCVHEYTEDKEAERFRTLFSQGRIRILLLSERYYFFRRRKIRGAQTFVFYGPPTFPWFLSELLDSRYVPDASADGNAGSVISVTILYFPPLEAHMVATLTGKIDL